jgi:hypothetical protein
LPPSKTCLGPKKNSPGNELPRLSAFKRFDEGTQLRIDKNVRLEQKVNQLYIARPAMRALAPPTGRSFPEVMAVPKYLRYEGGILFACLMARSNDTRQEPQGDDT